MFDRLVSQLITWLSVSTSPGLHKTHGDQRIGGTLQEPGAILEGSESCHCGDKTCSSSLLVLVQQLFWLLSDVKHASVREGSARMGWKTPRSGAAVSPATYVEAVQNLSEVKKGAQEKSIQPVQSCSFEPRTILSSGCWGLSITGRCKLFGGHVSANDMLKSFQIFDGQLKCGFSIFVWSHSVKHNTGQEK